jgi:hypothetical protein
MRRNFLVGILILFLALFPTLGNATNIFEITSPISKTYLEYIDYAPFQYSAFGDVTANLQKVGGTGLGYSNDFAGFSAGNIALIERGSLTFHDKVSNAEAAGAVGVIIYNQSNGLNFGTLIWADTHIPSISTSDAVGNDLLSYSGIVQIHLHIDTPYHSPVPEPATMLLLGLGLIGLAGVRRKFRN